VCQGDTAGELGPLQGERRGCFGGELNQFYLVILYRFSEKLLSTVLLLSDAA
jgi:hypothetical protein